MAIGLVRNLNQQAGLLFGERTGVISCYKDNISEGIEYADAFAFHCACDGVFSKLVH